MKYLVLLLIVLAGIWWIRQQRQPDRSSSRTPPIGPQTMVACTQCGVHVPQAEAVQGQRGVYCSEAHRQRHEG